MQTLLNELLLTPIPFVLAIIIIIVTVHIYENEQYKKGTYYQITKNSYSSVKRDKGKYGEFLIYKHLRSFENNCGKFLFNIYIPKDGNKTTEIDLLLVCSKGLFIFESKNYSGWIFGNENQKKWTQILYNRKENFYNPIMQNISHIKYLKKIIGEHIPMRSIIVFSDICTFKDVTVKSNDVSVIKRYNVKNVVLQAFNQTQECHLTEIEINEIYNQLYLYTQVSADIKIKHIETIEKTLN